MTAKLIASDALLASLASRIMRSLRITLPSYYVGGIIVILRVPS